MPICLMNAAHGAKVKAVLTIPQATRTNAFTYKPAASKREEIAQRHFDAIAINVGCEPKLTFCASSDFIALSAQAHLESNK